MTEQQKARARLEAYRDGELSGLARWRVERRLRRDPAARRALAELDALGAWLRESDAAGPDPDLWQSVRLRLAAADARGADTELRAAASSRWPAGYLALGAAAVAAAAVALVLSLESAPAPSGSRAGSVRWIDARGHPMVVLRDDAGGTIIWVPEAAEV